jgi:hypothetical protein
VTLATGVITTVAGNGQFGFSGDGGPAKDASLNFPEGIAVDGSGNLIIADLDNYRVRRVDAAAQTITTIAGTGRIGSIGDGGPAKDAELIRPQGVALDSAGNIFIADYRQIRRIAAVTTIISTVAGTGDDRYSGDGGPAKSASLDCVRLTLDRSGNLYIADRINHRLRAVRGPIP